jgi:fructuronate reductase
MPRLSLDTLYTLSPTLRPAIDPRGLSVGIVHLGLGAFHRAHQAVFTEAAMAATGDIQWGICGVTQRSRDVVEQLVPQDGLYSVVERARLTKVRVLAPLREILFAHEQGDSVLDRIAAPTTRIVTVTVTEKGYRHDPASGRLRPDDSETRADAEGRTPRTVVGQLVRGLQHRDRLDGGPLTVVCCDNLPRNGPTLQALVSDFCALLPPNEGGPLAGWIAGNATFPATMVDRIVPATTPVDRDHAAAVLGLDDLGAVVAEPFSQWVIQDDFACPRPAWDIAGALFTSDVSPYEVMKLRLLNGSHSALAYLGVLAGFEFVADLVGHDDVRSYVQALMDIDVSPTLAVPTGFDVGIYKQQLLDRFANPALRHRTAQIAMDGSQKLPQRLLGTIRDRLSVGSQPRLASLAVAAWIRYIAWRCDDRGAPIQVDDPLAARCAQLVAGADRPSRVVDALLTLHEVFGKELASDPTFRQLLIDGLESLGGRGALATLRTYQSAGSAAPPTGG